MVKESFKFSVVGESYVMSKKMIYSCLHDALKGRADFEIIEVQDE